jgi:hypothetical protein
LVHTKKKKMGRVPEWIDIGLVRNGSIGNEPIWGIKNRREGIKKMVGEGEAAGT